jgi:uncharacterized protein (DUF302 family)
MPLIPAAKKLKKRLHLSIDPSSVMVFFNLPLSVFKNRAQMTVLD